MEIWDFVLYQPSTDWTQVQINKRTATPINVYFVHLRLPFT